jgi:hypothetical protein
LRPWNGNVSFVNGFDATFERTTRAAIVLGDDRHTWQATLGLTAASYEMMSDLKSFHIGLTGGRGWLGLLDRTSTEGFWFVGIGLAATLHHERSASPIHRAKE